MAEGEYRRLTCGACNVEFTQSGRGRNAKSCAECRKPKPRMPRPEARTKPARAPKPPPLTACKQCGGAIQKPRRGKIYCSSRCAHRAKDGTKLTRAEYRQQCRTQAVVGKFICEHCGREAHRNPSGTNRKKGAKNRFCSMTCRKAQAAEREQLERARRQLLSTLRWLAKAKERNERGCHPSGYTPVVRTCRHCGLQWSALSHSGPTPYCPTPECQAARKQAKRAQQQKWGRGSKGNVGRAKHFGRRYRYFNPLRVFERDGWRCQICGVRTPKKLRGSVDPRAPELDHIIPLAVGGDHLPENCQCACRRCNGAKGARPLGQLLLIG